MTENTTQCAAQVPPLVDSHLVAVLHELSQVEQRLSDLGDVLGGQGQLDAADELVLLILAQLGPTGEEGSVEEVPDGQGRRCTHKKMFNLPIVEGQGGEGGFRG